MTSSAALAQSEEDDDDMTGDEGGEVQSPSDSSSSSASSASGGGGFAFAKGTMGIATTFPTGGSSATLAALHFMDADTALNLKLGFDFTIGEVTTIDDMGAVTTADETKVGTSVMAGYRMYKAMSGKMRPYLEPVAAVAISDFSDVGPTLSLAAGAWMGVELMVIDQFTLGTAVGSMLWLSEDFGDIELHMMTLPITASFYWN